MGSIVSLIVEDVADNALAETIFGLYKTEVIRPKCAILYRSSEYRSPTRRRR